MESVPKDILILVHFIKICLLLVVTPVRGNLSIRRITPKLVPTVDYCWISTCLAHINRIKTTTRSNLQSLVMISKRKCVNKKRRKHLIYHLPVIKWTERWLYSLGIRNSITAFPVCIYSHLTVIIQPELQKNIQQQKDIGVSLLFLIFEILDIHTNGEKGEWSRTWN